MQNPSDATILLNTSAATRQTYDAQATECLRVGTAERRLLLALAVKLAGDTEEGEDLYQQTLLDCHDAIQKKGFTGSNYKFYLHQSIKWNHIARQRAAGRLCPLDEEYDCPSDGIAMAPEEDALAALAAQVQQELEARYPARWVMAFQLHAAGKTIREIEALMIPQRHFTCIQRKVLRMKDTLRKTFGPAWANLNAAHAAE